tara:strand:+ start:219 stop:377 length:159 start_codon:yes stop_codon:yes gene_type:complete
MIVNDEIVIDKKHLIVKQAVKKLLREMRDAELAELIKKEKIRCRKLKQQPQG